MIPKMHVFANRAYYESHKVLAQRKAVEDKFTPSSPTHASKEAPSASKPRPKLQRQKSIKSKVKKDDDFTAPSTSEANNKEDSKIATTKQRSAKLKAKFKKSSIVSVAVTRTKQIAETVVKMDSSSKTKAVTSGLQKAPSPSKRKAKKMITRGQSTDF
jgi:hypothetical protein